MNALLQHPSCESKLYHGLNHSLGKEQAQYSPDSDTRNQELFCALAMKFISNPWNNQKEFFSCLLLKEFFLFIL